MTSNALGEMNTFFIHRHQISLAFTAGKGFPGFTYQCCYSIKILNHIPVDEGMCLYDGGFVS